MPSATLSNGTRLYGRAAETIADRFESYQFKARPIGPCGCLDCREQRRIIQAELEAQNNCAVIELEA